MVIYHNIHRRSLVNVVINFPSPRGRFARDILSFIPRDKKSRWRIRHRVKSWNQNGLKRCASIAASVATNLSRSKYAFTAAVV